MKILALLFVILPSAVWAFCSAPPFNYDDPHANDVARQQYELCLEQERLADIQQQQLDLQRQQVDQQMNEKLQRRRQWTE